MTNNNAEQERLRRLRDKQLADRDPHIKQRQYNRHLFRQSQKKEFRETEPERNVVGHSSYHQIAILRLCSRSPGALVPAPILALKVCRACLGWLHCPVYHFGGFHRECARSQG